MSLLSFFEHDKVELGVDEAGRGCLAGPVVAAAVILPPSFSHPLLNDSKKMRKADREALRPIIEQQAVAWSVGMATPTEIDEVNILNASFLAMHRAIAKIMKPFDTLLIDGNRFKPYKQCKFHCMVKGDARFASIAAASVLAKTHRDAMMAKLAVTFPDYGWEANAGYPTVKHRAAIQALGATVHHRKSFALLNKQVKLFEE